MNRGQVAFIAIIGVLIVIGAVGTYLIFSLGPEPQGPVETPSESFALERCVERAFDESISIVGLYGGWYEPHPDHLTKGDTFEMGERTFALWAEPAQIPRPSDLEDQVRDVLLERAERCTADLDGPGTIEAEVDLGETLSRAAIEIDGSIVGTDGAQRVPTFRVESDLPIIHALDVADSFTRELWEEDVLVDLSFNLVSLDPDVPLSGVEFSCEPKRWSVRDVRESYFRTAEDAVPHVSFDGIERVENAQVAPKLTFDLDSIPSDVSLSSYYFTDYGGAFEVEESTGDLMTSFVTKSGDGLVCQNTYQFWYSMRYPIVFTLTLEASEPYLFRFAVPVTVNRNVVEEDVERSDGSFCSDVTPRTFTLAVEDAVTGSPVPDVRATFVCGQQRCPLGSGSSGIEDRIPSQCLSGSILIDKEGYERAEVEYAYDAEISGSTTVELEPLTRIDLQTVCSDEPCTFDAQAYADLGTSSHPLSIGENYVPNGDLEIVIIENRPGIGPVKTYELEPESDDGSGIVIVVNTDSYADSDGRSITDDIFPGGIVSGARIGDAS